MRIRIGKEERRIEKNGEEKRKEEWRRKEKRSEEHLRKEKITMIKEMGSIIDTK